MDLTDEKLHEIYTMHTENSLAFRSGVSEKVFRAMIADPLLSNKTLALRIGVSQATVSTCYRNFRQYILPLMKQPREARGDFSMKQRLIKGMEIGEQRC